ncbi:MAG: GspH/FimT family pseudopilin [Pseudomonadota bacterium]|nr:GspH/FimT family pseudopilin [Pseudomonadota bacterium]
MRLCINKVQSRIGQKQGGFTLVELMVTIAVLAIISTIAYPSFTSIINSNRLTSAANEVLASAQLARSEAVRLNQTVVLCPANAALSACDGNDWQNWLLLDQAGAVLRSWQVKPPVQIIASANISGNDDQLVFSPDGFARDASGLLLNASIASCIPTTQPTDNLRAVRIGGGSRMNVQPVNGAGACAAPANN